MQQLRLLEPCITNVEQVEPSPTLLCRGISYRAPGLNPLLILHNDQHEPENIELNLGDLLGFKVLPGRWCLGYQLVHDKTHRTQVPCPEGKEIQHGTQCESCVAADQARAMHDFHRSGRAGAGLRDYLMQEHWLYIASFANGATKVGTAANPSKWRRLAEQGAVCAAYVGWAVDGAQIRILEDTVTRELGFTQQVRAQSKVRGLLESHIDSTELMLVTNRKAAQARELIAALPDSGTSTFTSIEESWQPPEQAATLLTAWNENSVQSYPEDITGGEHGFVLASVLGQSLGVNLGTETDIFVVDATRLKGRKLQLGSYSTEPPAIQSALF